MGRVLLVAWLVALGLPAAARAHSGGSGATDYRTTVERLVPASPGAQVRVRADDLIEVRLRGPGELVVLGYAGEPYLRLRPEGAFENRRSPAVAANSARPGTEAVDSRADPRATPLWRRISDQPVAVWHDHRAHWMSRTPPAVVRAAPGEPHLVDRWTIPIRVDGRPGSIDGRLEYLPPPNAWAWWTPALVLALVLAAIARRARATLALTVTRLAAALAVGAGATLAASQWLAAPSEGLATGAGSTLPPAVSAASWGAVAAVVLLVWLVSRRVAPDAEWAVLLLGAWMVGGGALFGQLADLQHAVVPSTLPASASRALVVIGLAGLLAPAVWAWRVVGEVRGRAARRPGSVSRP